jgi:hypothetical protein
VSEIFDEISEDLRREQFKKVWERYSAFILGAALLIVAGVGGWRGYSYIQAQRAAEAGAAFEAASTLSDQGKHAEAEAAFNKIAADGNNTYRTFARFRGAAELATHDVPAAIKAYDALAADTSLDQKNRDLAQLRASGLLVDTASYDELQKRLEPLTGTDRTYRHTAREYLVLSAWKNGNVAAARNWIDTIMTDAETPTSLRSRAENLQALLPSAANG